MSNFKTDNNMKILKQTISILCLSLMAFGSVSCLKDDPIVDWDDIKYVIELPYKSHYLLDTKPVDDKVNFQLMVNYAIDDAAKIKTDIPVQLGVDESLVAVYNAGSATKYTLLPASAYTLPSDVVIRAGNRLWQQTMTVNTSGLDKGGRYILPVRIVGVPEGYTISGNFGHVYLRINMP